LAPWYPNNYQLVVEKPTINQNIIFFYGTRLSPIPNHRITFNFADTDNNCTYIRAALAIVVNPGTSLERTEDVSKGKDAHDLQIAFEKMKANKENK
jgi:hypothetical protein